MHRSSTDGKPPSPSPAEHHYAGPSRVNWLPCEPGASSRSLHSPQRRLSMHAHPLGRSASSPTLPLWPAAPRIYSHPSMSSHRSLQLDRLYAERPVESEDSLALLHLQPLSPIIEQTQLGGTRRTRKTSSVNESPLTPETPASLDHGAYHIHAFCWQLLLMFVTHRRSRVHLLCISETTSETLSLASVF